MMRDLSEVYLPAMKKASIKAEVGPRKVLCDGMEACTPQGHSCAYVEAFAADNPRKAIRGSRRANGTAGRRNGRRRARKTSTHFGSVHFGAQVLEACRAGASWLALSWTFTASRHR